MADLPGEQVPQPGAGAPAPNASVPMTLNAVVRQAQQSVEQAARPVAPTLIQPAAQLDPVPETLPETSDPDMVQPAEPLDQRDAEAAMPMSEPEAGQVAGSDDVQAPAEEADGLSANPNQEMADEDDMSPVELEQLRAQEVAFQWQASEYVHHHKGASWYVSVVVVAAVLIGLAILFQYWLTIAMFAVTAVAVLVYARKPPRTLTYELTRDGIAIDGRMHLYKEFRSFGVIPDTDWHSIDLEPKQRLSPRLAILFDEQDFDDIIGHLELHLPRVDRLPDAVERLSRYIRF